MVYPMDLWRVDERELAAALAYYGITPRDLSDLTGWSYGKCWNLIRGAGALEPFQSEHHSKEALIDMAHKIGHAQVIPV